MQYIWTRVRDGLWFAPSIAVAVATAMAIFAVRIPPLNNESALIYSWLFDGGAEGARGVLAAIAGGLITVTGTVFSVTIVALQLASSQFTPRVLGSFMADRVNQSVLAVFIGTFTYTLLVLRSIRSEAADRAAYVPQVGVTVALLLLLLSIGALIVFIDHAAQSIRVSTVLHRESARTVAVIRKLADHRGSSSTNVDLDESGDRRRLERPLLSVRASESGYLQAIHIGALWRLSRALDRATVTIRMEVRVGAFVFPGKLLASVASDAPPDSETVRIVRDAFVLGPERTPDHDLEFGLVELSDIALRALSPSVNDPTTAIHCIDRLTEVLAALAAQPTPPALQASPDGRVRLLLYHTSFERAAALAFDQIRHFGCDNPLIASRLLEAITDLMGIAGAHAQPALRAQAAAVQRSARSAVEDPPPSTAPEGAPTALAETHRRNGEVRTDA
jgi:uncharacterized membrane protein